MKLSCILMIFFLYIRIFPAFLLGFSKAKSWLPVNSNYWTLNAEAQKKDKPSHYSVFKDVATLRRTSRAVRLGDYKVSTVNDYVFVLTR